MPAAIPLVVQAGLTYAGVQAGVVAVATFASAVAVGSYERNRAKQKARDAYNKSLRDRLITVRSAVSPRKYVLGTVRTGGTLLYADTIGSNQIALDTVTAYAANTTSLVGWYLGPDYVAAGDFPGAKYGPRKTYRGVKQAMLAAGSQVVTLAHEPIDGTVRAFAGLGESAVEIAVTDVTGAGVTVTVPSGGASVDISYEYQGAAALYGNFYGGLYSQTIVTWGSNYPSPKWTASHRMRGTTVARTLMLWDEDVYQTGAPEVSLVLTGIGVANPDTGSTWYPYDPRTETPVMTGTTNPALLAAWWATLPRSQRGMGIPSDWIDWDSVAAAANVCDETISVKKLDGSGYENIKRYECNTVIDTAASPSENLKVILGSMAGSFPFTAGKYRMFAGAFRSSTLTVTDDMVIGTEPITVLKSADDAPPNVITSTIADATKNWAETSVPQVRNATYILEDGGEVAFDLPLPATTDPRQANYLMGVALERMRPAFTCMLHMNGAGEDVALGDTLDLDLTNRSQYAGKTFEVVKIIDKWNGTFDVQLVEMKSTSYALDADRFTPINQPPPPDTSYLWDVADLTGFDVVDGQTSDGIEIAWDLHSQGYVRDGGEIQMRYRELGHDWRALPSMPGNSTGTTLTIAVARNATYEFQARAVNPLGATSPWSYEFATVVAAQGPSLNYIGEFATPPATSNPEGSVYRNSTDKDTYVLRDGAWELFLEGGEDGAPGTAKLLRLLVTSNVFHVTQDGTGSPSSIVLTAQGQNLTGSPTFTVTDGTVVGGLTGTGQTRTLNFSAMTTDSATIEVTQDGMTDTVTILKVRDGSAAVASVLTNESHTIAADTEGDVASFADAVTWMKVYRGGTDDTANWSFSRTNSTGVASTLVGSGADRGKVSIDSMSVDSGYVDITATRSGFPTQTKRFVVAKSRQGAVGPTGAGAKLLALTASSQVFQITKAGANNPASITFTAAEQNLTGTLVWSITPGATLTGSGSTRTLTFANMGSLESATVTASKDGQSDSVTIVKLREGQDGATGATGDPGAASVVSLLTNEAHTVAADSAGVVTSGLPVSIDMDVFVGLVDDTINWSFARTNGAGVTSSINNTSGSSSRGRLTVTALSVDASTVTITATKSGHPTQTKVFTITKSRQGTQGTVGPDGTRGSAHAYLSGYGAWNETTVDAYFTSTYGGKVVNDMVTVYNATSFTQTRIWTGSSWGVVTQAHDGALLIDGSTPNSALTSIASHGMSITPDPGFEDLSLWALSGEVDRVVVDWNQFGRYALRSSGTSGAAVSRPVPIDRQRRYRAIARAIRSSSTTRLMALMVIFYDATGNVISGDDDPAGWPVESGAYHYFGLWGQPAPEGSAEYSVTFGSGEAYGIPATAKSVSIGSIVNYDDGTPRTGTNWLLHARIQQLQDTELIAPGAATDVLVIRTAGYSVSPGGTGGGGIRTSSGVGAPDLTWTNDLGETVDVVIRGSASVAVNVTASAVRVAEIGIIPSNASGATFWSSGSPKDIKVAIQTPAVNGTYQGSAAPSLAITVAAGETIYYNLATRVGVLGGDNYAVSDGQLSLEVIKR